MSISESSGPAHPSSSTLGAAPLFKQSLGPKVRRPVALSAMVAMFEGTVMALEFLFCAIVYHFVLLETAHQDFAWTLYLVYAGILGVIYAGFSANAAARFFDGTRQWGDTLPQTAYGWTASFGALLLIAFLSGTIGDLSRVSLTAAYLLGLSLVIGMRGFANAVLSQQITEGELRFQKVALIGQRTDIVSFLLKGDLWRSGQSITGTLYLEDIASKGRIDEDAIAKFAAENTRLGADYIVLAGDVKQTPLLDKTAAVLKRFSLNVAYALSIGQKPFECLDTVPIGTGKLLRVLRKPLSQGSVLLKRTIDLLGAGLGLLLLSPALLLVALTIRLDSAGPAVFKQARRGFNGTPFNIYKFRTMHVMEPGTKMRQAERGDKRITRVGRFLRATNIDELPQLINVLLGQMSLVGPRPHALCHDDELSQHVLEYAHRQRIKPGMTGWAQVNGYRGETATVAQIQGRTQHDLYYIDNWSVFLDAWILLLTLFSPGTRRNAF
jgi:exopolysaccharide biosynthesis polyprenyl glycosylphosphotransferase